MAETLLSISEVLLYGREMADITFNYRSPPKTQGAGLECDEPPRPGRDVGLNSQFENQLSTESAEFAPRFARIYGFSFEGGYYDLDVPIIMLVHGDGIVAELPAQDGRAARAPESPDKSGGAAQDHSFADDIRVWSYDKADFSIRLDAMTGPIEDILLECELGSGGSVSGGRVSGGRVAGGRVSGGRVSGGRVSGGRVSGGRDD
ncbi:MAG: hypothetical protein KTR18_11855 [Acidiferrobacterales bacterium]|nr:hypothetical protein [Acidiferrobacterales bacterium]